MSNPVRETPITDALGEAVRCMSSTTETRADQLLAAFVKFHTDNPQIWELFCRFTQEAIASGRKHYSADCVCHRIRWNTEVETSGSDVKINNNHTAYYARMFQAKYPEHAGFFRNRKRPSVDGTAFTPDLQVYHTGPPQNDQELLARLGSLA